MKLSDLYEHSAPPQLMSLAKEFKKEFDGEKGKSEWGAPMSTVQDETGSCSMVSDTFIAWLKEKGLKAKFITGHGAQNQTWAEKSKKYGEPDAHTAAEVQGYVIDFTARQFDKSMPNPRIIKVKDFESEWKKVEQ